MLTHAHFAATLFDLNVNPLANFPTDFALNVIETRIIVSCNELASTMNSSELLVHQLRFGPYGLHALETPLKGIFAILSAFCSEDLVLPESCSPSSFTTLIDLFDNAIENLNLVVDNFICETPLDQYAPAGFRELILLLNSKDTLLPVRNYNSCYLLMFCSSQQ